VALSIDFFIGKKSAKNGCSHLTRNNSSQGLRVDLYSAFGTTDSVHQTMALREAQEATVFHYESSGKMIFGRIGKVENKEGDPCTIWRIYAYHYYQEKIRRKKYADAPEIRAWMTC